MEAKSRNVRKKKYKESEDVVIESTHLALEVIDSARQDVESKTNKVAEKVQAKLPKPALGYKRRAIEIWSTEELNLALDSWE